MRRRLAAGFSAHPFSRLVQDGGINLGSRADAFPPRLNHRAEKSVVVRLEPRQVIEQELSSPAYSVATPASGARAAGVDPCGFGGSLAGQHAFFPSLDFHGEEIG
jgi:hypothetical protein